MIDRKMDLLKLARDQFGIRAATYTVCSNVFVTAGLLCFTPAWPIGIGALIIEEEAISRKRFTAPGKTKIGGIACGKRAGNAPLTAAKSTRIPRVQRATSQIICNSLHRAAALQVEPRRLRVCTFSQATHASLRGRNEE